MLHYKLGEKIGAGGMGEAPPGASPGDASTIGLTTYSPQPSHSGGGGFWLQS